MRRRSNTVGSTSTAAAPPPQTLLASCGQENLIPRAPRMTSASYRGVVTAEPVPKRPTSTRHSSQIAAHQIRKNLVFPRQPQADCIRDLVKKVDSESDSEEDDDHAPALLTSMRLSSLQVNLPAGLGRTVSLSSASSLPRRSNAVSRQVSDLSGGAAGSGFAATRQLWRPQPSEGGGCASNAVSRTPSLSQDLDSCATSMTDLGASYSRRSSLSSMEGSRLQFARQIQAAEQQAREDRVEQRKQLYSTEQVHLRRWVTVLMLARSAAQLIQNGNLRVSAHHYITQANRVLSQRFVPMWRLFVYRRRLRAERTIARFCLRCAIRRRRTHRTAATAMVRSFLTNKLTILFSHYARWMTKCVVKIQRMWRRVFVQRNAAVQLHVLKARDKLPQFCKKLDALCGREAGDTKALLGTLPERMLVFTLRPRLMEERKRWFHDVQRQSQNALDLFTKSHRQSIAVLMKMPNECRRTVRVLSSPMRRLLSTEQIFDALRECFRTLSALRDDVELTKRLSDVRAPSEARVSLPPMERSISFGNLIKAAKAKEGNTTN